MRGRPGVGTRRRQTVAVAVAVGLFATACIGVTSRDEFEAIVDERGGGLTTDLVTDALEAVGAEVGTDDLELTWITVSPGSRMVVMEVRDPVVRDNLDRWIFTPQRGTIGPEPVQVHADDDVDGDSFLVSEVPGLLRTEEMTDAAFAALGFDGPSVDHLGVRRGDRGVRITITVESARASGRAEFDAGGNLVEAKRT